ncbi:putative acetyltransferase [Trypanosoma cruzi]|uniref:Putative acetyltransferase n=1 Tax=Trypanosoma cruzi TaxID=5693 RepID=A0A2V2VBM8_TRYCR|nr:putative acetyltransferase [Trypanosoma cruzi]
MRFTVVVGGDLSSLKLMDEKWHPFHIPGALLDLPSILLKKKLPWMICTFFAIVVLFEVDDYGYHFVGYFSKEWRKSVACNNSLSCVMVLPPYRNKGYGAFLIKISYEMGRIEGIPGSPERPLSAAGKKVFIRIWREEILQAIFSLNEEGLPLTMNLLSWESGMAVEDVAVALHRLNAVFFVNKHGPLLHLPSGTKAFAKRRGMLNIKSLIWTSLH